MFCLKTSSGLQNCPFGRQYVFFFVRCRFTCLAYLGGLSFDFCECFTLFNDEALNFLTFYTQTAKAVCDACTLLPCSPIYLQGGLGGTNEPQVCDATPKRFFICVLWKTNIFHQKTAQAVWGTLFGNSQKKRFVLVVVFCEYSNEKPIFARPNVCVGKFAYWKTKVCATHAFLHTAWSCAHLVESPKKRVWGPNKSVHTWRILKIERARLFVFPTHALIYNF